jgi:hypothetical protein
MNTDILEKVYARALLTIHSEVYAGLTRTYSGHGLKKRGNLSNH